ncbi:hypothetical protein COCON_G00036420 [Conger conger]|uniref:HEAT repeat-containing protein 1 n=1 Tax=Conger conger TaxID=82655 RepID=A0A9Q1DZS6_CONCO|nr:hypothetical protein COCON_G00036420 [Conger conger]
MTSLAHQLKRLALPQNDSSLFARKEVASLLFDPKDAATIDRDTFFALGCTGLEELLGIEPLFEEFQETLFSQASKTLERSVQTKEVNQKLDAGISLFLSRLSPYFLLKPAQKCLEWLVYRFHIHLYNMDCLIACILPYHETKVFVRVIQLLKISDPTHRWNWLHGLQKPGVPLARGTLITHCYKDLSFMDFICTMVTKSVKAYSGSSGNCPQLRVVFSFYASTIVPALEAVEKVKDTLMAKLLPYVQKGLKSSLADYKAATYMVVCQLAVKVVMEAQLVDTLAVQLAKSLCKGPALHKEGLGCLIVLLQNQKVESVGKRAYGHLCAVPGLVSALQDIAAVHDISPLLRYLLPHLVHSVVIGSDDTSTEDSTESTNLESLLESVIQDLALSKGLDNTVAKLFLEEYLSHGTQSQLSNDEISALNQRLLPLVRAFESKCPGALDVVLEGHISDTANPQEQNLFHQFISLSMSSGKYKILAGSDTSLLLSLNHPLPSVRNMAVEHLKEILNSGQEGYDEAFLKDAVLERMKDDVPEVVQAALKALEMYCEHVGAEDTVSSLLSLLQRIDLSREGNWSPILVEAVRVLDSAPVLEGNPCLRARAVRELLPFLVITGTSTDAPEHQLACCIAQTSLLTNHPLTQGWAEVLKEVLAKTPPQDLIGVANQRLIATMTSNFSTMVGSLKRNLLEELVEVAGSQRNSLRERAAFLVLTYTLVQGLPGLPETQHLHTAQRVYSLLEPHLLELTVPHGPDQPWQEQAFEEQSAPLFPPADRLGEYLYQLRLGESGAREHALLLVLLLRLYIVHLKCPVSAFKGQTWWNPEKLDTATCCYLRLLCQLFEVIINGAGQGPLALSFRGLMQLLLQVQLSEPSDLFKFLSLLWGYSGNLGDQLDFKVSAVLQTQALYVGRALLSAQTPPTLKMLASDSSPVVPSLLACLSSPVREVRRAAVVTLQVLSGANGSPFQPITERLLQGSEELISDPSHISQALGQLYEEAVAGKGKRLLQSIELLLQGVQSPDYPSYTAKVLLRVLRDVNGEPVLAAVLPAVERLLDQCGPEPPHLLNDEALLLQLLLGKYNEQGGPLLTSNQSCLELFIRALGTTAQPFPGLPSIQIIALEQITKPFFGALGEEKIQQRILGVMFDLVVDGKNLACAQTVSSVFKALAVDGELVANELTPPEKPKASGTVQQARRSKMLQRKTQDSAAAPPEEGAVFWQRATLILELLQHKKKLKRPQVLVPALFNLLSRSLELSTGEQGNMEYTKQLILSCLLNICQKLSPDGGPSARRCWRRTSLTWSWWSSA